MICIQKTETAVKCCTRRWNKPCLLNRARLSIWHFLKTSVCIRTYTLNYISEGFVCHCLQAAALKPACVEKVSYAMPLAAVDTGWRQEAWTAGWFVGASVKNWKIAGRLSLAPLHAPCRVVSDSFIWSRNLRLTKLLHFSKTANTLMHVIYLLLECLIQYLLKCGSYIT